MESGREPAAYDRVLKEVLRRDVQDCTRAHSPLKMATGAVYVDSTTLTVEEVVELMLRAMPPGVRG